LFDDTLVPVLKLDHEKLEHDVGQIVDAPYFQQLKLAMRQRREQSQM
jgi:hypothetical protein